MRPSEEIKEYALEHYIGPARNGGKASVDIRAGDIHKALRFSQRTAAVCSTLGSQSFQQESGAKKVSRRGPGVGMNTVFTFEF
jgi:5-methylcytosine-specific restriction protein B